MSIVERSLLLEDFVEPTPERGAWPERLLVANPHGFCAGVKRSVADYNQTVEENPGATIFSIGEVAHNTHLVRKFKEEGVTHVKSSSEVPIPQEGEKVIALIGPHGYNAAEVDLLKGQNIEVRDTVCPLVLKPYGEIKRNAQDEVQTLYWGQEGHAETDGAMAIAPDWTIFVKDLEHALSEEVQQAIKDPEKVAFASQTTHNWDEAMKIVASLREKYPNMKIPSHEDICFATKNRQDAVKELVDAGASAVVVVGSKTSSNSTRLSEVATERGANTYFVDSYEEINLDSFYGEKAVGITSGASVEEATLFDVIKTFVDRGSKMELVLSSTEKAHFKSSEYGKNYYNQL